LLNAAGAIAAYDGLRADSLETALATALDEARRSIDSGAARDLLREWVQLSQRVRR
jgi:anthranilate phosphoribosyltransferase